jgi:hypothetical protein
MSPVCTFGLLAEALIIQVVSHSEPETHGWTVGLLSHGAESVENPTQTFSISVEPASQSTVELTPFSAEGPMQISALKPDEVTTMRSAIAMPRNDLM